VDHRRTNKSVETLKANVDRLKEYKARLVVFGKKQDATKEAISTTQGSDDLFTKPKLSDNAVTYTTVTDEMKSFRAYDSLRRARSDVKLVGIRIKKAKEGKDGKPAGDAPKADKSGGDDE
jgi:large subunit ribosomal protein L13e